MKCFVLLSRLSLVVIFFSVAAFAQTSTPTQPPAKDPQALAVLQQSVASMGNSVPSDSTANGTITTNAGGETETGSIVILTRGSDQSSEQIQTTHGATVVYSQGQSATVIASVATPLPVERSVTDQAPDFPLALLANALNNPDTAFKYIGLENLANTSAHHIQVWNSFASVPKLQRISALSVRDIWIDSSSGLPLEISYVRHEGGGNAPAIAVDASFSDYRNVSGVLYPFSIQRSLNGTPWATITIQSVVLNTGLTDSNFPVQTGAAQ